MRRKMMSLATLAVTVGVLMSSGCADDPKKRIALLQEENDSLALELERLRGDSDNLRQEKDNCQADLLTSRQTNQDLMGRLSRRPAAAPAPQKQLPGEWKAVSGGAMVAVEGSVLFRSGKVTLRPESKSTLSQLASEIKGSFSGKDIYVFGHTDSDPIKKSGWKDNRELSSQRALAVVRYMQSQGIPAKKLVACGWGEHRPVASNTSTDGKKRNRRVEIFAADPKLAAAG